MLIDIGHENELNSQSQKKMFNENMWLYVGHLNTVVSISLVSGAKESASAPMAAIYLSRFGWKFPLGFCKHLSSPLHFSQLYVSRCQVLWRGRSIALNSGAQVFCWYSQSKLWNGPLINQMPVCVTIFIAPSSPFYCNILLFLKRVNQDCSNNWIIVKQTKCKLSRLQVGRSITLNVDWRPQARQGK